MKQLLVGIPMHGAIEHVKAAILSVQENAKDFEWNVLVMDDFSPADDVYNLAQWIVQSDLLQNTVGFRSLVDIHPTIIPARNPNLGLAVNTLLDHTRCGEYDYYLNLESDVQLLPHTLRYLLEAMEQTGAPMAFPMFHTPEGDYDFIFYGAGIIPKDQTVPMMPEQFKTRSRPKWCNLGCLLMRADVAADPRCRVDAESFKLWCVDQDLTCQIAQHYGRPVFVPEASVLHAGRQSTKEGQTGGYGYLVPEAVRKCDTKWASYLAGGLFAE